MSQQSGLQLLNWSVGCYIQKSLLHRVKKNISDLLNNNDKSFSTGARQGIESASEAEILPYYFYRNKPFSGIERQQVNSEGYRNGTKEFGKKEKGKIRIIAIGGSTIMAG